MMKVAFRVDASIQIGTGHVMRCLTLADELNKNGAEILFICCMFPGNLCDYIIKKGYSVYCLPYSLQLISSELHHIEHRDYHNMNWSIDAEQTKIFLRKENNIDWLIIDHYSLNSQWESVVRPYVKKIMVIDDLANRHYDCDLLLNQTFGENGLRYEDLLPAHCRGLFGAKYALLRPQFAKNAQKSKTCFFSIEEHFVHIFFGGSDYKNYTARFSRLLAESFPLIKLEIAVGLEYKYLNDIITLQRDFYPRINWRKNVKNMASQMKKCTVALGAPGITTWERACMGLPSAYLATSENQKEILKELSNRGLCFYIGSADIITKDEFISGFTEFLKDKNKLNQIRQVCLANVDGYGAKRVSSVLLEEVHC